MPEKPEVKIGVNEGGGEPPGFIWSVWVLNSANSEIRKTFSAPAVEHLILQMEHLADEVSPSRSVTLSIDKIEEFYELRDKGGVLGNVNARIFFGIDHKEKAIVTIGGIKKQNNGKTPIGDVVRMRRRWRDYQKGIFGKPANKEGDQ